MDRDDAWRGEGRGAPRTYCLNDAPALRSPGPRIDGYGLRTLRGGMVKPGVLTVRLESWLGGGATVLSNNALKLTAPRGRHCRLTELNQWRPRAHSRTGAAA